MLIRWSDPTEQTFNEKTDEGAIPQTVADSYGGIAEGGMSTSSPTSGLDSRRT